MIRRRSATALGVALLGMGVLWGTLCGTAWAASYVEEIDASPGGRLMVDLEPGGSIEISTWDRDRMSVRAEFTGPSSDNISFDVLEERDRVVVRAEFEERQRRQSSGGRVVIRIPARFDVRLQTSGGSIRIDGLEGDVEGETMGGELELSNLRGRLNLTTLGGNIELRDSEVDGEVQTHGGNVRLRDVVGCIEARSLGGNVTSDNVQPRAGSGSEGEAKISTHGGNVDVPDAPAGADLETLGGNITVVRAARFVKATTMGGNIWIRALDGWVRATTMGGEIEVTMSGDPGRGRRDARLRSNGGDITLTVPEGSEMDIDITLAYTRNSQKDYEIRSDFPLEIRRPATWDYDDGTPRKYIYGSGTTGRAVHRIKIETINGDVELRKGG